MNKSTATGTKSTTDSVERRRVQNRLAQRNYRNNVKQRLQQLEWLDSILLDSSTHSHKQTSIAFQPPITPPSQFDSSMQWPQMTDVAHHGTDTNPYIFVPSTQGLETTQLPCFNQVPDISESNRASDFRGTTIGTTIDRNTSITTTSDKTFGCVNTMGSVPEYHSIYQTAPTEEKEANTTNVQSPSAIFRAASHGHTQIVKILLDKGAKLESRDSYGRTLLHIAVSRGFDSLVSLLIEEGINLNAKDDFECTPLQIAAETGLTGIVELLVNAGAMIDTIMATSP